MVVTPTLRAPCTHSVWRTVACASIASRSGFAAGWVTVGTEVDIRHLAAALVGATVRTSAKVFAVERRVIRFEVEAFGDAFLDVELAEVRRETLAVT